MFAKMIRFYIPGFIKKKKLKELCLLTANAFQIEPLELKGLTFAECLQKYALFTKENTESYLNSGSPLEEIKHRLYQNAYILGQNLRKNLRITTWDEAVLVFKAIYKFIGIDCQTDNQGEFIIKQCFFSDYYTREICMLISSLDEGLAAGLSDGGRLCFYQRITEGNQCCKGCFKKVEVCDEKSNHSR